MTEEKAKQMIKADYKFICEWQGIEYSETEYKRLVKVNLKDFIIHYEKYGEISEFQYK